MDGIAEQEARVKELKAQLDEATAAAVEIGRKMRDPNRDRNSASVDGPGGMPVMVRRRELHDEYVGALVRLSELKQQLGGNDEGQ